MSPYKNKTSSQANSSFSGRKAGGTITYEAWKTILLDSQVILYCFWLFLRCNVMQMSVSIINCTCIFSSITVAEERVTINLIKDQWSHPQYNNFPLTVEITFLYATTKPSELWRFICRASQFILYNPMWLIYARIELGCAHSFVCPLSSLQLIVMCNGTKHPVRIGISVHLSAKQG